MTGPRSDKALVVEIEQAHPMPLAGAFDCAAAELLALVGPSGAGKTSMLRVLAGLMRPARGRIEVAGEVWCDTARGVCLPPQRRHVGMVFQHYALMPHLTALDNVALSLLHLPRGERVARARSWLDHVRLTPEQQRRRPAELSGGQQQRVGVARALAREPRLLLLDEPFSAVDQLNRQGLYQLLAELRRELEIPIVLVTHDLHEAGMLADRLVVMDAGRVLQQGPSAAIHRTPRNARVADLVGIQNRFEGQWLGAAEPGWGRLRWIGAGDPARQPVLQVRDKGKLMPGQRVTWVIPGEGIVLHERPAQAADEFDAEVIQARHLSELTLAELELAGPGARMQVMLTGAARARIAAGDRGSVQLDLGLVHVMPIRKQ